MSRWAGIQGQWSAWWEARLPRRDHITLNQRNLYILPTKAGWGFAAVFMLLLLASINEQINLGYALSFLLGGTAMTAIYQTHGNLQGVSMRLLTLRSVHAGDVLSVGLTITNKHRKLGRYGLQITAGDKAPEGTMSGPGCPQDVELNPGSDCHIEVDVATYTRGRLTLPRITIDTRFPLGLFRAWAYWRPEGQVLIWPSLDTQAPPLPSWQGDKVDANTLHAATSNTEMHEGLRAYRRGDPQRLIAWKKSSHALASGTGLISREPAQGHSPDLWLDYEHSPGLRGMDTEARLSRLASWLLQAEQQAAATGTLYGLRLPGMDVTRGAGSQHLRHCLDTLSTWSPSGHDRGAT
ncbi:MAG: DUF58 domain-containing protein [Polaromonas sp.]|nr:DUF58 domain-containing protein [Polaromonas sp.]